MRVGGSSEYVVGGMNLILGLDSPMVFSYSLIDIRNIENKSYGNESFVILYYLS